MAKTKILLFGATGAAGLLTIQRALDTGCEIIAYVRSPDKLPESFRGDDRVTVVKGTLTDREQLTHALSLNPTVVISLLGPAVHEITAWLTTPSTWSSSIFVDFYRLLMPLMRAHSCRRIYVMGTISIVDDNDRPNLTRRLVVTSVWAIMHGAWNNMVEIGKYFKEEVGGEDEVEWTVFRLGLLYDQKEGENEETVNAGYAGEEGGTDMVKREDIAAWLVEQARRDNNGEWSKKMPYLWSAEKKKE